MKFIGLLLLLGALSQGCEVKNTSPSPSSNAADEKVCCKQLKDTGNRSFPSGSIFTISDTFRTQKNTHFQLSSFKGKPTVIGMIFTHCTYACPKLTTDIKSISEKLGDKKTKVNFVLVSFDVDRDNPKRLKKFANDMGLDSDWVLLHGNEQSVRTLSVLLNIQFEKDAEGNFSHTNMVSVLDKDGILSFQKEGLEADHQETINEIQKLTE